MNKVEAAVALIRAIDAFRAETSEANADDLLAALDGLLLLPEAETDPKPEPVREEPEREVYGWMRLEQ